MPDINLRFNLDMLIIGTPIAESLARLGADPDSDLEYLTLMEPDTLADAYRLEAVTGAQCLVTNTYGITPAQLAHKGMRDRGDMLAKAAVEVASDAKPQHLLAEIGPCGLPLDESQASSLKEHRNQYERAARFFDGLEFDAFLLSEFASIAALKCAIAGIRMVSAKPLLCTVVVDEAGLLPNGKDTLEDAVAMMAEFQADVCGFATKAPLDAAVALAKRAALACANPLMVQLQVTTPSAKATYSEPSDPYWSPDTMVPAAAQLRAAGVQFLRAAGKATPAYTATLAAITAGLDVVL